MYTRIIKFNQVKHLADDNLDRCPFKSAMVLEDEEKSAEFIFDLFHSLMQGIFLSVPDETSYDYDVVFEKYTNRIRLFDLMDIANMGVVESCKLTKISQYNAELNCNVSKEVDIQPSHNRLAFYAFANMYNDMLDDLRKFFDTEDNQLNPYAEIELKLLRDKSGFKITVGDDIRHRIFTELFEHGRYIPEIHNKLLSAVAPAEDNEQDML